MAGKDKSERIVRCAAITAAGTRCRKTAQPGTSRCAHHGFSVPGRPTKLDDVVQARIVDAILAGSYLEPAAAMAGVSKATLYRWLRRADEVEAKALEHAEGDVGAVDVYELVDPAEWLYLDFRHALKSAEAYSELGLLERVRGAGEGWQAFMTILERRHPSRWGRRAVLDHTIKGELESRSTVEIVAPDDEARRRAVAAILAGSGALDDDSAGD